MQRRIVLASTYARAAKVTRQARPGAVWFYAGRDLDRYTEFRRRFGAGVTHSSFNEHPDFVGEHRSLFLSWTEEVHRQYGEHLAHWLSDRFSSYPYASDLYFHCLCLVWFRHLLQTRPDIDVILIAESSAVLSAANVMTASLGDGAIIRRVGTFAARAHRYSHVLVNLLQFGAVPYFLLRFALVRGLLAPYRPAKTPSISIILDTYVFDNSFDGEGRFQNRYFTELADALAKGRTPAAFLPILHRIGIGSFPSLIRKMRSSHQTFLLMEDHLTFFDYLRALGESLSCASREKHVPRFRDVDVQPLVNELLALKLFSASGYFAHLMQKLPGRLQDKGILPDLYVQWNENSTFNKALNHGFHHAAPNTVIVGGKPFVPPLNHLNLFCTSAERSFGFSPDRIVTCGSALQAAYAQYDPQGTYLLGASFRYDYLWKLHREPPRATTAPVITVLLPYDLHVSRFLLSLSSAPLQELMQSGCQVVIKAHPANKPSDLSFLLRETGLNRSPVRIAESAVSDILPDTSVVVSSSSSSAIEAMCLGIPAVLVGLPVGLDLNMHDLLPSTLWKTAFNEEEVGRALHGWALRHPLPLAERQEVGRGILGSFFEPVTQRSMNTYLAPFAAGAAA